MMIVAKQTLLSLYLSLFSIHLPAYHFEIM